MKFFGLKHGSVSAFYADFEFLFNFVETPTPFLALFDPACEFGAKTIPPVQNVFKAHIHSTFAQQIFYIFIKIKSLIKSDTSSWMILVLALK